MRSRAPALLPIFRSQHQAELLSTLYLHPDTERTVSELATAVGVPLTTAHREVQRLVEAGLLMARSVGRSRLVRSATGHPAARALAELLHLSFGPPAVLEEEFADVAGVETLVLFGSWAERNAGAPGPPPADVDVLVVGSVSRAEVYGAVDRAQERLQIPVNPVLRSAEHWAAADADALVAQIRAGEHLILGGSGTSRSVATGTVDGPGGTGRAGVDPASRAVVEGRP